MLTEIICIIDVSGSMNSIVNDAIGGFNSFIEAQKKVKGEAKVSLVLFNNLVMPVYSEVDIRDVKELTKATYQPVGATALLDAVGKTVDEVGERLNKSKKKPDKVVVAILTDGEENASTQFTLYDIREKITHQTNKYSWEFIFLAANQDAFLAGRKLNVPLCNTFSFDATSKGVSVAYNSLSDCVTRYRS